MKKIVFLALFIASGLTLQSCGSEKKDSTEKAEELNEKKEDANTAMVDDDDAEFAVKAANGGMLEVEAGRMAAEKGASQAVKDFGSMMVQDHSKANDELKSIAELKNIAIPSTVGEDMQEHLNDLSKVSGAEFDKKYVDMMVKDHEDDVKAFTKEAEEGKDAELKAFAAKTATVVKGHLEKITTIQKNMK
ncbi:DUF4142 domain-containing protein [Spirosoma sp. KUDC1026]|uniref:DUF4142 domain-containing protein n=1 Tax=Spirosoma sp. KUDC1026 TaxID=2745947 RepID=UPI00159BC4ED|nr:DUF4142 domain-containing protein [Spirosoma sp. KUDC1026]QKZ14121.1 DUF4142 domain-containing protein [Spirosoma sp. KUDC1026]